jgi:hypothetical protein
MPDITKCEGFDCKIKKTCYRYTSVPSEYQSYFSESPIINNGCEYYWQNHKD